MSRCGGVATPVPVPPGASDVQVVTVRCKCGEKESRSDTRCPIPNADPSEDFLASRLRQPESAKTKKEPGLARAVWTGDDV